MLRKNRTYHAEFGRTENYTIRVANACKSERDGDKRKRGRDDTGHHYPCSASSFFNIICKVLPSDSDRERKALPFFQTACRLKGENNLVFL